MINASVSVVLWLIVKYRNQYPDAQEQTSTRSNFDLVTDVPSLVG